MIQLPWLNVVARNVSEVLWYLHNFPPPRSRGTVVNQNHTSVALPLGESSVSKELITKLTQVRPPEITTVQSSPPSLFALIIGINTYKDPEIGNLLGAVSDADAVQAFLLSELNVPKNRIVNLRDEEATREAIVAALQNLARNPDISTEDPILIYYAGHGSEVSPPLAKWKTNNKHGMIQMLLPHDFASNGSTDHQGQGVFDVTLSSLLTNIARNKSDNITVIFDSCHSGSGTRKNERLDKALGTRGFKLPPKYTIPPYVFGSDVERASSIAPAYEKARLRSHVLLAACMEGQTAREVRGGGVFTSALLGLLQEHGVDQLTYEDVITHMPDLPLQNPQCEGQNQNRVLFHSKVANRQRKLYLINPTPGTSGSYVLEAGEAHGVTTRAEFAIFSDKRMTLPIGSVIVKNMSPFSSKCSATGDLSFNICQTAYAVQTRVGEGQDIRILIEPQGAFLDLFTRISKAIQSTDANRRSFRLVDSENERPDLTLITRASLVQFHINERICRQYGLTLMPYNNIRVDEPDSSEFLFTVLSSAADFYWNLHHSNKTPEVGLLSQKISVECFKLVPSGEITDDLDDILIPDPEGHNLNVNGTVYIDVDIPDAQYGYRVTNSSAVPLYAALFYFDVSDLSIAAYYTPGAAAKGQVEFSLPAKGSLSIGFDDNGAVPYVYFLRENQSVDVGFLKLYVSTTFVDYSGITQTSPFHGERGTAARKKKPRLLWDTIIIPVVQRKGGMSRALQ